jgi:hypothetical protein
MITVNARQDVKTNELNPGSESAVSPGMELMTIQSKIYELRGVKVMLDYDLAAMYGMETKVLKQAVKRNLKRFEGDDFMFVPTKEELSRCQIGTLNKGRGYNLKYAPFAFTVL